MNTETKDFIYARLLPLADSDFLCVFSNMANSTAITPTLNTTTEPHDPENLHIYIGVTIFSIVFLFVITIPTVVVNGMTLFAIYKDPLRCFRNPLTMFVTGVLVADFIAGFIVYPFYGAVYSHDLRIGENDASSEVYHVAIEVLMGAITVSFLTLLGLAISQLIAIKSPMRYDHCVTDRGVKIGLICIWAYAVIFITIPHFFEQGEIDYFYLWFLIIHVTVITVALVILYIVTYLFFTLRAARQLDEEENKQVSKEFFKATCLLALLQILLVWPVAIALYFEYFHDVSNEEGEIRIETALLICDDLLFTKFLLDPIILVWRIPKYRLAMKMVYPRCFGGRETGNKSRVSYSRSHVSGSKKDPDSVEDVDVEVL